MKKSIVLIILAISLLSILSIGASAHGDSYYTIEYQVDMEENHTWEAYPLNFYYDASAWIFTKSDAQTIVNCEEYNGSGWARAVVTATSGVVTSHSTSDVVNNKISTSKVTCNTRFASCAVFTGNKSIGSNSVAHQQLHFYE